MAEGSKRVIKWSPIIAAHGTWYLIRLDPSLKSDGRLLLKTIEQFDSSISSIAIVSIPIIVVRLFHRFIPTICMITCRDKIFVIWIKYITYLRRVLFNFHLIVYWQERIIRQSTNKLQTLVDLFDCLYTVSIVHKLFNINPSFCIMAGQKIQVNYLSTFYRYNKKNPIIKWHIKLSTRAAEITRSYKRALRSGGPAKDRLASLLRSG